MTMKVGSTDNCRGADTMELIDGAPWREAVTYRETWPHEYVVINQDGQQELLAAFCERIRRGEGSSACSSSNNASTCSWATTSTGR